MATNWVDLPMRTLLAERTPATLQGRVYGAVVLERALGVRARREAGG